MSLKKTWFSYVLWFLIAVPAVFVSYNVLSVVLQDFYAMLSSYVPGYEFYADLGAKAVTVLVVVLIVVLIHLVCGRTKTPAFPGWLRITGHILFCVAVIAGFCVLRYKAFHYVYFMQTYSSAPSEQVIFFYELSKVGAVTEADFGWESVSFLEQTYICMMRTVFLFLGNKIEIMLFVQLVLQLLSLVLLMVIGWTLQKGIYVWVPALMYAVAPTFFYSASDAGIANFWTFIVIFVFLILCILEKAWKKTNITYLVMVFVQLLFVGFVFYSKMNVLLYGGSSFVSGGVTPGAVYVLNAEMIALAVFLIAYSVSFFMDKQDHRSLFVLPFMGYGFLAVWLSNYEYEVSYCLMLLAGINLFFLISQSMRVIFRKKPDVITGRNTASGDAMAIVNQEQSLEPARFEWAEMKEVMHSTKGVELNRTGNTNIDLPLTDVSAKELPCKTQTEEKQPLSDAVVDRKAPIENVLPMPKKHKPKVLDYAFEPAEDMMHYDVEIENDEYDY